MSPRLCANGCDAPAVSVTREGTTVGVLRSEPLAEATRLAAPASRLDPPHVLTETVDLPYTLVRSLRRAKALVLSDARNRDAQGAMTELLQELKAWAANASKGDQ